MSSGAGRRSEEIEELGGRRRSEELEETQSSGGTTGCGGMGRSAGGRRKLGRDDGMRQGNG